MRRIARKFRRNDALRMNVVPIHREDTHDVYTLISEGWHPYDVAIAYGYLTDDRQLARILGSPLWKEQPTRKMWARDPSPKTHSGYYSWEDKEDAVWLVEHGWNMADVSVMLGMHVYRDLTDESLRSSIYKVIPRWERELNDPDHEKHIGYRR